MKSIVGVVDHGVGNSISIINLLRKIGCPVIRISDIETLESLDPESSKLIIPGVGSFDAATVKLKDSKLDVGICDFAKKGAHILGICLGMQLLFEGSHEGESKGLNLIPGYLERLKPNAGARVPHVGWNYITVTRDDVLFRGIRRLYFYHNHTFGLASPNSYETSKVEYAGGFSASVRHGNIVGVQFHPEKSHQSGELLVQNFISG